MFSSIQKKLGKRIEKHIHKHIKKHCHKHVHRILHKIKHFHHTLAHLWELLFVGIFGLMSFMFASFNTAYDYLHRETNEEIAKHLVAAMDKGTRDTSKTKIISTRDMDWKVANTFSPWYCTYWAARISPEFFPYIEPNTQQRTWWWNAIDRCDNAAATWYKIWSTPSNWALIVYKQWGSISVFGHVGKVMYYNSKKDSLIVRDMNRLWKYIMTDRREDANNQYIKCFIYPKKTESTLVIQPTQNTINILMTATGQNTNNTIVNISTWQIITKPTSVGTTSVITIPTIVEINKTWNQITLPSIQEPIPTNLEPENTVTQIHASAVTSPEKILEINEDSLSDMANHFFSQNNIMIKEIRKTGTKIWDSITITIEIKNKDSGENYEGLLPILMNIIPINEKIEATVTSLQFIKDGKIEITLKTKENGKSWYLINIDNEVIAKSFLEIQ